ncbi:MAG: restriction endonuclease subunit R, partial [Peptostreptococcaceae bacterium]|nr:restriction endonuclease subunit R [Peptostreptococcaceae bacterium]
MSYQSEAQLEETLIKQLVDQGFNRVSISDEEQLKTNFRNELFEYNKAKLDNKPFTDKEFERILRHLEGKSIFQSAKLLRDKFILEREDGEKVYIEFLNSKDYSKNRFQVTNQTTVVGKYTNRY